MQMGLYVAIYFILFARVHMVCVHALNLSPHAIEFKYSKNKIKY